MATPVWLGATAAQAGQAGQINQFLGTHAVTYLYTGTRQGGQSTAGSGSTNTNGTYLAQSFTAGSAFSLGRITLTLALTGTPVPTTVSIQTSSGGAPSGTVLATTTLPHDIVPGSATLVSIPVPCALTSGTGYWIVVAAAGDASDFYAWSRSNQTSGASTSTNGTSWSTQTYGFIYNYYDQSVVLPLAHTYEDSGARWTAFTFNASNQPTVLDEYTVAQGMNQYTYSGRSFTYTSGSLTSIS